MNYIVAGGCGFIGSHLVKKLLDQDHNVIVIDNLCTGMLQNIEPFVKNPKFTLITQNITDTIYHKVDYVFNLACPASPVHYLQMSLETLDTCHNGTLNLLKYCERHKVPMFQASTSEIYGDPLEHPQTEEYFGNVNCLGPRACYDNGKRIAETLCYEFASKYGVKVHLARIFNTYGPNMAKHDGRVISEFIVNALQDRPLIINDFYGPVTRSFCYIDDMINAFMKFSDSDVFNTPVNLGNPEETNLRDLANLILQKTNSKSTVTQNKPMTNDPIKRKPNIERAQNMLHWNPHIDLSKGLDYTIEYFKAII